MLFRRLRPSAEIIRYGDAPARFVGRGPAMIDHYHRRYLEPPPADGERVGARRLYQGLPVRLLQYHIENLGYLVGPDDWRGRLLILRSVLHMLEGGLLLAVYTRLRERGLIDDAKKRALLNRDERGWPSGPIRWRDLPDIVTLPRRTRPAHAGP